MSTLVQKIAALIAPHVTIEQGEGQDAISRDAEILDQLYAADGETSIIRLWTNSRCLVTTRAIARMPAFVEAAAEAQASGWPVHVRHSGGSTVVHRPGILNISMFWSGKGDQLEIDVPYRRLVSCTGSALQTLGIDISVGFIAASYCDGRYNVLAADRKIAGTASHSRLGKKRYVQMAHASLVVNGNLAEDIEAITRFEKAIGIERIYQLEAHATLAELIGMRWKRQ